MKTEKLGPLLVHCTSTVDSAPNRPALILLHGYGAPGDDLVGLWPGLRLPEGTRGFFPEAPRLLPLSQLPFLEARAWWDLDVMRLQQQLEASDIDLVLNSTPAGLAEARNQLTETLSEIQERYSVQPSQLLLGGFSQGGMLALDTALHHRETFAGVLVLSGAPVALSEWRQCFTRKAGLKVFMSHGRDDPLLPFRLAERLHAELVQGGLDVDFVSFAGGHGIAPQVLQKASDFAARALQAI